MSDSGDERKGNFWTTLPGLLTALATLVTAIAGFLAIMDRESPIVNSPESPPPQTSNLTEVKFNLYTQDYQPIEFAEVQFVFDGAPVSKYTDRNGYVNVEIPKRKDIEVILRKDGFETRRQILNLQADPYRTITIYLQRIPANVTSDSTLRTPSQPIRTPSQPIRTPSQPIRTPSQPISNSLDNPTTSPPSQIPSSPVLDPCYSIPSSTLISLDGNSIQTALEVGQIGSIKSISGWIGNARPVNYYRFCLASDSKIRLTWSEGIRLNILNEKGNVVDWVAAREVYDTSLRAGNYYLKVHQFPSRFEGDYQLQISVELLPAP